MPTPQKAVALRNAQHMIARFALTDTPEEFLARPKAERWAMTWGQEEEEGGGPKPMLTARAGPCVDGGKRHRWGPEEDPAKKPTQIGISRHYTYRRCLRCPRVQVLVYTRNGNHIEGYENKE